MAVRVMILTLTALMPILAFALLPLSTSHSLYSVSQQNENACPRCIEGDHIVTNGVVDMYIGGTHRRDQSFYKFPTADTFGSIIGFAPTGTLFNGDIMLGTVYIRQHNTTEHLSYKTLDIRDTDVGIEFTASGDIAINDGDLLQFVTHTVLAENSDKVSVSLTVTNTGKKTLDNLIYSLYFDPHQMYDFSPSDGGLHPQLKFRGYPRDSHLIVWDDKTARQSHSNDFLFGWDGGMILPDPLAVSLTPGESDSRQYSLLIANNPSTGLKHAYEDNGFNTHAVHLDIKHSNTGYYEITVRNVKNSAVFFRSFYDNPAPIDIELPEGEYIAEANFFPGSADCQFSISPRGPSLCTLEAPKLGKLTLSIVDGSGQPVPGKVTITGLGSTSDPRFRPVNPTKDDGYWESYKNSVFPMLAKKTIDLPEGSYLLSATRGPEYSLDQQQIIISHQQTQSAVLRINPVIDRPDLISIDSHLHTLESDGAVDIADKISALVASGINMAIATDHNFPVDYQPVLKQLQLEDYLTVITGAEVTVPERLDYNSYPMTANINAHNNGGINALSTDISSRFKLSRERDSNVIIQVNHPRFWQFDYFNWFGLDPESAAFAYEGFDLDFDVLEVVNGAIYNSPENIAARKDWFNLLRRGYFFPLMGSSDSHEIDKDEPGFSRTYVYNDKNKPPSVEQLMQRLREGRSFASNGPILELTAGGNSKPGDTVGVSDGIAKIEIDVWTVDWIKADILTIYVNGIPQILSSEQWVRSTTETGLHHIKAQAELHLKQDAFIVAEVTGTSDLFPMIQARGSALDETPVRPFALTNPIFVDVDGNGQYDSPLPQAITLIPNLRTTAKRRE